MTPTIERITIAVHQLEAMAAFYGACFSSRFEARGPLRVGHIGALTVVLCPAGLAGVHASAGRFQPEYLVDDVDALIERALQSGGTLQQPPQDEGDRRAATLRDPDDNPLRVASVG